MRHLLSLAAGIIIFCAAIPGRADTITFDPAPSGGSRSEGDNVSDETFAISGVNITVENATFAQEGGGLYGFRAAAGVDKGNAAPFSTPGNWFITDQQGNSDGSETLGSDFGADPGTNISISFNQAVMGVSFLIADLETWTAGNNEFMSATIYDSSGDAFAETIELTGGSDGSVQLVSFVTSGIWRLEIDVYSIDSGGNELTGTDNRFAFGVDNLTATAVPTPSSLAALASLSVMGLVGVGLRRRRNRRVA